MFPQCCRCHGRLSACSALAGTVALVQTQAQRGADLVGVPRALVNVEDVERGDPRAALQEDAGDALANALDKGWGREGSRRDEGGGGGWRQRGRPRLDLRTAG